MVRCDKLRKMLNSFSLFTSFQKSEFVPWCPSGTVSGFLCFVLWVCFVLFYSIMNSWVNVFYVFSFIAVFILIYAQIIQNETNENLFLLASQFF